MCELCKNIDEMHVIKDGYFKGQYLPSRNENQIVKDGNKFHIWSDGGGDCFQSGICIEDVEFCPKCGQKLDKEQTHEEKDRYGFTIEELMKVGTESDLMIEITSTKSKHKATVISVSGKPENCKITLITNLLKKVEEN